MKWRKKPFEPQQSRLEVRGLGMLDVVEQSGR